MEKFGLLDSDIAFLSNLFLNYTAIDEVIIFGSRAKGNYKNGSDIDLTLIGESLAYRIIGNIENDLDELYLPYTFDISIYHLLENDKLLDHIGWVGKVFYERVG